MFNVYNGFTGRLNGLNDPRESGGYFFTFYDQLMGNDDESMYDDDAKQGDGGESNESVYHMPLLSPF